MKKLILNNVSYNSRLIIGSGKYTNFSMTKKALEASGAEMITVALKRTNIGQNKNDDNLLNLLIVLSIKFFRILLAATLQKML